MFSWFRRDTKKGIDVKFLVVGLGNPGAQYDGTRHNVGFDVCDLIVARKGVAYDTEKYAQVALGKVRGKQIAIIKPDNVYESVRKSGALLGQWYMEVKPEQIIVVVDDLNLDFGRIRIKKKGGAGGHNGLTDIEQTLQTNQYNRIRIGIGNSFHKGRQSDYVLGRWNEEEIKVLPQVIEHVANGIESIVTMGLDPSMNQFNTQIIK